MKLYYWTYNDYDCCSHYAVFAESEQEAWSLLGLGLLEQNPTNWKWAAQEFADVNGKDKHWELKVFDIAPGMIPNFS